MTAAKDNVNSNAITLEAYNSDMEGYLRNTPSAYDRSHRLLLRWIDASLALLPPKAKVLEIGSASGRDALYIKSKGYDITCSDAATSFVAHLKRRGLATRTINLLRSPLPKGYTMIFANAVFPHFTAKEAGAALKKIYNCLPRGGILAFNIKQGHGAVWTSEKLSQRRYIHYWTPEEIQLLVHTTGFHTLYARTNARGDLESHIWTHLILQK